MPLAGRAADALLAFLESDCLESPCSPGVLHCPSARVLTELSESPAPSSSAALETQRVLRVPPRTCSYSRGSEEWALLMGAWPQSAPLGEIATRGEPPDAAQAEAYYHPGPGPRRRTLACVPSRPTATSASARCMPRPVSTSRPVPNYLPHRSIFLAWRCSSGSPGKTAWRR